MEWQSCVASTRPNRSLKLLTNMQEKCLQLYDRLSLYSEGKGIQKADLVLAHRGDFKASHALVPIHQLPLS